MPRGAGAGEWGNDELDLRRERVREALLGFLRERTRLDWFKHKVRWRLSRQFIWPGGLDARHAMIEQAVDANVSVDAFAKHVDGHKQAISAAIERYNHAVKRHLEVTWELPCGDFDEAQRDELRQRRITFQGIRDELYRRARDCGPGSGPELIPELLSLRLAILSEDVRASIFRDVSAMVAHDRADSEHMSRLEREQCASDTEVRLRCVDRYHVARLLAVNYSEGRRLMELDSLIDHFLELVRARRTDGHPDAASRPRISVLREVLQRTISFLEEIFPATAGTHDSVTRLLRIRPDNRDDHSAPP